MGYIGVVHKKGLCLLLCCACLPTLFLLLLEVLPLPLPLLLLLPVLLPLLVLLRGLVLLPRLPGPPSGKGQAVHRLLLLLSGRAGAFFDDLVP